MKHPLPLMTRKVTPRELLLDLQNPRFLGEKLAPSFSLEYPVDDARAQEVTRRYLLKYQSASPLVESILRIGFLPLDRIVVRRYSKNKYVVIEGNRRVAAIKTIIGDVTRHAISIPDNISKTLQIIEVLELNQNDADCECAPLLIQGLRHISGVRNWGPFQQGHLLDSLVNSQGMSFQNAALTVGLSPRRVAVVLRAYQGLKQMIGDQSYTGRADVSLFSCFEQAYLKIPVRNWLGWDDVKGKYLNDENRKAFYAAISILDGLGAPRLLARHVRDQLPSVLTHDKAKHAFFVDMNSIEYAYSIAQGEVETRNNEHPDLKMLFRHLGELASHNSCISNDEYDMILDIHKVASDILKIKSIRNA